MSESREATKNTTNDRKGGLSALAAGLMSREIKFRQAITEEDGTFHWHYWGYLHTCTKGMPVFISPRQPLEHDLRPSDQYIGRKNCTKWEDATPEQRKGYTEENWRGVEIYGGAIVQSNTDGVGVYEIVWLDLWAGWFRKVIKPSDYEPHGSKIQPLPSDMANHDLAVLGNTEEHPEMLRAEYYEAEKAS